MWPGVFAAHQWTKATWQCAAGCHIATRMRQRYALIEVPVAYINTVWDLFRITYNLSLILIFLIHTESVWSHFQKGMLLMIIPHPRFQIQDFL
jgi:hypothetical protein